jgi:hypothetical protein
MVSRLLFFHVTFIVSTEGLGGGPCPPFLLGRCLDLAPPVRILPSVQTTDVAEIYPNVPLSLSTGPVWIQAVSVINGVGVKSNVVQRYIGDSDQDLVLDSEDNCPSEYNPFQVDDDFDGVGAECDCNDDEPVVNYPCQNLVGEATLVSSSMFGIAGCDATFPWEATSAGGGYTVEGTARCGALLGDIVVQGVLQLDGSFVGSLDTDPVALLGSWNQLPDAIMVTAQGTFSLGGIDVQLDGELYP